ncbi:MAG TPA: GDSL-type esterase/lipase family protein [Gemmataceae bacterium]|nr:GDSL-type esterase/lipase family protein [Gemmataceae bacterium]
MRLVRIFAVLALGLLAVASFAAEPSKGGFPLKNGDIWVMAGDSITAQHLHSNYFEAFCYARYPKLKFAFRNSGVGGHTIPTTLARFDYDIAAWKPTVVSVELGMNDAGNTPTERFIANMGTMVGRIRGINARPVILSASPVNDGSTMTDLKQRNKRLEEYATALKEFCEKEQIPYADQFHGLVNVWGKNKVYESIAAIKPLAADESLAGVEHLRAFLAAQEKVPVTSVSLQGDPVHPGPPGQLMMAAALLKDLGAEAFVSSVTVDAAGKLVEAKGCSVTEIKSAPGGGVSFDRLDECLPFPIPDNARTVVPIAPDVLALSRYTLKVTGLKAGDYRVIINQVPSSRVSAADLAAGVNLTALPPDIQHMTASPIVVQSRAILAAVDAKEQIVGAWRQLSRRAHASDAAPELKEQLAELTRKVEDADAKIREAAKPQKLRFEISTVP